MNDINLMVNNPQRDIAGIKPKFILVQFVTVLWLVHPADCHHVFEVSNNSVIYFDYPAPCSCIVNLYTHKKIVNFIDQ